MNIADDQSGSAGESAAGAQGIPGKKKSDESWKERARREKEKLAATGDKQAKYELPAASFLGLVEEISVRAMLALGQLRNPATGEVYFDLDAAKYSVDLLTVLAQKTKGNLEPAEKTALDDTLHALRLAFVQASRNPPTLETPLPGEDDYSSPGIDGLTGDGRGGFAGDGAPPGDQRPDKPGPKIIF